MRVELTNGHHAWVNVKYAYKDNLPFGTEVFMAIDDKTEYEDLYYGVATVKGPDKFSRLQGKKWALISMFHRHPEIRYEDRAKLFRAVCPQFFAKHRKENPALTVLDLEVLLEQFKEKYPEHGMIARVFRKLFRLD